MALLNAIRKTATMSGIFFSCPLFAIGYYQPVSHKEKKQRLETSRDASWSPQIAPLIQLQIELDNLTGNKRSNTLR